MKRVIELDTGKKQRRMITLISILILAVLSVAIMLPFLLNKAKSGHDINYHFGAIRSLTEALKNGSFGSRIYEYLCEDYGYGTGLFYTMIPSSIAALFIYFFHMSAVAALTLEFILLLFVSGIICYFFLKRIVRAKWMPLVLSAAYIFFPYVICDIYIRFAFSEIFLLPLLPMIAWALYEFVCTHNYGLFAVLFITGFSLAIMLHLSLTVYIALFALLYLLLNFKRAFNKKSVLVLSISCVLVLVISAIFTIPMFVNYSEITLTDIAGSGKALYQSTYEFVSFSKHYYLQASILIMLVLYVIYLVGFIKARKRGEKRDLSIFATLSVLMFFCTPLCFVWLIMGYPPLNMIQFIWRLYFLGSLACVYMFNQIYEDLMQERENKQSKKFGLTLLSGFVVVVALLYNIFQMTMNSPNIDVNFDSRYSMLTSFNGCGGTGDYLPNGATLDFIADRISDDIIYESKATISDVANLHIQKLISFSVENSKDGYAILKLPYSKSDGLEVYQKEYESPFELSKLEISKFEASETETYIKIEFKDSSYFRVYVDYAKCNGIKQYLTENPVEFKVKNKNADAKFTNFVKTNSHTYQVDVETTDMIVVELPTLYYKGYKISLKTSTGTKELNAVHGENGLIEVNIAESGTLLVEFEGNYVTAANVIGICGVVAGLAFVVVLFVTEKSAKKANKNLKKKLKK